MHRHVPLLPIVGLVLLASACGSSDGNDNGTSPPPDPTTFQDGFEAGLDAWTKGFDLPPDPNHPGHLVEWAIEASQEQAFEGSHSARFRLDGRQDDGTIWLERVFDVAPDADYTVDISLEFFSEHESFNTIAMVATYAGAVAPVQESDFDTTKPLNRVAGWDAYVCSFPVRSSTDGRIHVAVGLSVVWETWITYFLDDVRITIQPRT